MEWIGDLERDNESYQFNIWRLEFDADKGTYRVGEDSGCSCPSPFESHKDEDYTANLSYRQALALLDSEMASSTNAHQGWFVDEHRSLREKLREHGKEHNFIAR